MSIVSNTDVMNIFKAIDELDQSGLCGNDLTAAIKERQDEIVERLMFLVYSKAKPYKSFSNYEDLVQEGCLGLVKAVQNFKHELFPNFFIYSSQWMNHYIKRAASKFDIVFNPNKNRVVYSEPSEEDIDPIPGPDEILYRKECGAEIGHVLDEFPDRDSKIVREIFGLGGRAPKTLREVGPQFDLTHERVRQIKNTVLDKLKKNQRICKLNKEYNDL